VGILPAWGMSQRLPRLIGTARARQLSFTGNFLDAATAERWGLVSQVVAPEELLPTAVAIAVDITSCDRRAVTNLKRLYEDGARMAMEDGLRLELTRSAEHMAEVRPEDIAARRAAVQARGRQQSS
jgi:enoyl-CoA hydratase